MRLLVRKVHAGVVLLLHALPAHGGYGKHGRYLAWDELSDLHAPVKNKCDTMTPNSPTPPATARNCWPSEVVCRSLLQLMMVIHTHRSETDWCATPERDKWAASTRCW